MKVILRNFLVLILGIMSFQAYSQRTCGSMNHLEMQKNLDPKLENKMRAIETFTNSVLENPNRVVDGIITIPVVFHVVYKSATENISEAQLLSQITVLNEDFRRTNTDADNTWSQASDVEIEFCLATVDPNGNATNGITRTSTTVPNFTDNDNVKHNATGGKNAWPASDYLNIWVCDINGFLGYAQFPGGSPSTDGVVIDYQYIGTTGTASYPFDLGRTTTHEVGHWLNLRHIWGDGGCGVDDFVADTPESDAPNYGCSPSHVSCGTTDMVQNYMDYSDDNCMNLFTLGQRNRMRAIFEPGGFRASLLNSNACGNGTVPTCSDGIQNGDETGVDCGGSCTPCTCDGTTVSLTLTFDNYPEETSWSIVSGGTTIASGGTYGNQPDGSTLTLDVCLADGCYDFIINDTYGDGMCCSYGSGSYSLTDGTNTLASGGSFTHSETTNFCVGSTPTCNDGIQNGDETGVDCGGSCVPCATCNDGIQNGDETGVDCGGSCGPCPTCNDGIQNGDETGIDCGGSCAPCATCNDGIQNGDETGVDCGGSCAPCNSGCNGTEVTVTINFDNYPEETSWLIIQGGQTFASGSNYGSQPDGSTYTEVVCLADGCYDFVIKDAYGDGICCGYGNGSYSVTNGSTVFVSGGNFGSSETTNFCVGGTTPTCNDGVQNGDETGVDCGGSFCTPCTTGCSYTTVNNNTFESGWGIWNDGGSDCRRSSNDAAYANSGSRCVRLRDNTASSTMTTDNMNWSGYDELTIDFSYYPRSMENNEDFWLQISTNGGSSFSTVASWAKGTDFNNNVHYSEQVVISGPFTANTKLRFRCDASSNYDFVYIDDVFISGCASAAREEIQPVLSSKNDVESKIENNISDLVLYPNPVKDELWVKFDLNATSAVELFITDMSGKIIERKTLEAKEGQNTIQLSSNNYSPGLYFVHLKSEADLQSKRFVVMK